MKNEHEYLATEPVGPLLFKLAFPTVVAQLINMLYNIVDRIYIGHMPVVGDLALTGVGVCMPIIMIVTAFAALVSSGGAPRASIYMGRKDNDTAEKILGGCFFVQIVISLSLMLILLFWNKEILMMFGASVNTIEYATSYMKIYAMGTLFVQVTLGMNAFITAQGFTRTSMISVLIGAITNIILDPIFIFVFDMGVAGAAWATILSQALSCTWVILFLISKRTILKLRPKYIRYTHSIVMPCLILGLAAFIMQSSESVITVCFNSSLLRYGGDIAVGAMTILSSVMMFAMLPLQGIAQGAQPITSYNYGAKNVDRVKKCFKLLLISSLIYSLALGATVMFLPKVYVSIFTPKPELIEYASWALRIYGAGIAIFGIQIACQQTFTAIGKAKQAIICAVFRKFILLIPLIYIMPLFMANKEAGVYMAESISDIAAVIFTATMFFFEFRKALQNINHEF